MSRELSPDFNFFLPVGVDEQILKSAKNKKGEDRYNNMIIEGVASDLTVDSDSEILEPKGFELSRFLKYGWLNYDHRAKDNPKYNVGEPIDAKIKDNKLHVKGKLFKANKLSRDVFDTMLMLEASGSSRKMGWSIEGKALERDPGNPKRITKALITNIAITPHPKNHNTFANIVKGQYSEPLIEEYEYDKVEKADANGGKVEYLLDISDQDSGIRCTIDKDLKLKVEKAISAGGSAQVLIHEDLESKLKVLPFGQVRKSLVNVSKAFKQGKLPKDLFEKVKENKEIYKKYI